MLLRAVCRKSKFASQVSRNNIFCLVLFSALIFLLFVPPIGAEEIKEGHRLIELQKVIPGIQIDLKYTTPDNFMKEILYPSNARGLLLDHVAKSLGEAQKELSGQGLGLKIFDAYRPLSVQKKMWAKFPMEGYVANPAKGSNHNRGAAVDLTLVDKDGHELPMPSAYDEFSERAHWDYQVAPENEKNNRKLLREVMEKYGFKGISTEWWHFDFKDAKTYPVLDVSFDEAAKSE